MRRPPLLLVALAAAAIHCGPGGDLPRDRDLDGVASDLDCDNRDGSVFQIVSAHVDGDADGFGRGEGVLVCTGPTLPHGYAGIPGDCDDANPSAWRLVSAHRDADRDGFGVEAASEVCGSSRLPAGWVWHAPLPDCDDRNAAVHRDAELYADGDGDGYGLSPAVRLCIGAVLPSGYAEDAEDCAPEDGTRWSAQPYLYRDGDLDGFTRAEAGVVCTGGSLPPGFATEMNGLDCDDTDPRLWTNVSAFANPDHDGVGVEPPVTACAGWTLPTGFSPVASDCREGDAAAWQMLPYAAVDRDGDGATVPESGTACASLVLAPPYRAQPAGHDCDDASAAVHTSLGGFADADGDGFGAGVLASFCTGGTLPAGIVATGGDCAQDDAALFTQRPYTHRDADADGYTIAATGEVCSGAALPVGYATAGDGSDCDDADAARFARLTGFADADGDGFGAGAGAPFCTGGSLPAGFAADASDCAASDPDRWRVLSYAHVDRDGDGYTSPETGALCSGADPLPSELRTVARGNDCDDADPASYRWVVSYPDADGDGVGTSPRVVTCLGATLASGQALAGYDVDDADPLVQGDPDEELLQLVLF